MDKTEGEESSRASRIFVSSSFQNYLETSGGHPRSSPQHGGNPRGDQSHPCQPRAAPSLQLSSYQQQPLRRALGPTPRLPEDKSSQGAALATP